MTAMHVQSDSHGISQFMQEEDEIELPKFHKLANLCLGWFTQSKFL